ncbi:histidine phosphatase family protein [Apilactobacillus timberlakei]|uniref:histidine phosphatase family protein n=1 Tax=Apilactobacillus timberlakei TaxID=2008380 RepID=UPI0011263BA8|nr:histidine phosphatase family protein [Apilactobacillus timberlakei]TPR17384.1 histidine phosphatase family protein [Apilactobacillus timberlakei]
MKLYFIRHGKTKWNLESRYQGAGGDSDLLPQSYKEMEKLGSYLENINFAHAYSSPIKRARITAERVISQLKHRPNLTLWSRLEEFNLGKMEGQKFDDVKIKYPQSFDNFRNHPEKYDAKEIDGESFQDVIDRMRPAVNYMVKNHNNDDNLIVFSHGAALKALINSLLGTPIKNIKQRGGLANTSTTILETNDCGNSFNLVKWNDTEYLNKHLKSTDLI